MPLETDGQRRWFFAHLSSAGGATGGKKVALRRQRVEELLRESRARQEAYAREAANTAAQPRPAPAGSDRIGGGASAAAQRLFERENKGAYRPPKARWFKKQR